MYLKSYNPLGFCCQFPACPGCYTRIHLYRGWRDSAVGETTLRTLPCKCENLRSMLRTEVRRILNGGMCL